MESCNKWENSGILMNLTFKKQKDTVCLRQRKVGGFSSAALHHFFSQKNRPRSVNLLSINIVLFPFLHWGFPLLQLGPHKHWVTGTVHPIFFLHMQHSCECHTNMHSALLHQCDFIGSRQICNVRGCAQSDFIPLGGHPDILSLRAWFQHILIEMDCSFSQ